DPETAGSIVHPPQPPPAPPRQGPVLVSIPGAPARRLGTVRRKPSTFGQRMEADDVEAPYPAGDPQARVSALAPATPPTEPQGRPDAGLPGPGHEPVPPPRHIRPRQRMRRMDSTRRST